MDVTGEGLDLKDTLLDSQERYIGSSSTQVEMKTFLLSLPRGERGRRDQ
jgi:hypothetical protein